MRFGALPRPDGGATFRLWAPAASRVELRLAVDAGAPFEPLPATAVGDGWFESRHPAACAGARYRWRIDGTLDVPDPASRRNPEGPHGPSELVDPSAYEWQTEWAGRPWHEAVFYQLHVGSFTPEGSFSAAEERLPGLAELGITAVQLMPLADFPGDFGWGYDGVLHFAPYHFYGSPEALKRFVDAAHRCGLMVFADVVYNHFGPDGNYLNAYAPRFFTEHHHTAWGAGINFDDGDDAATVREFFIDNALYWLTEFRFDGLRLDAVHAMLDDSRPDILEALSARVRKECAGRRVHLVLENDANHGHRLAATPEPGRYDGQWNGDVHHALHVLLTGEHDGYYAEYDQPVAQLGRALAHGFARQGGPHNAEGAAPRREAEGSVPLVAVVNLLQNHDQVGNRAFGERLTTLAEPAALRLAAAIGLLAPTMPLLFMGEEFGATTPFLYFADWHGDLRRAVQEGRQKEFAHFPRYADAAARGELPDPCSRETFERCRLDATQAHTDAGREWLEFHRHLLALRRDRLWPLLPRLAADGHVAEVLGERALQVVWHFEANGSEAAATLRLRVNLSPEAVLLAPAASTETEPSDATMFQIGNCDAAQLGPWSGQWQWLTA